MDSRFSKHLIVAILLTAIFYSSCDDSIKKIEGEWMAVESRHYDTSSWISDADGAYFIFHGDSLNLSSVRIDTTVPASINYINKKKFTLKYLNESELDTVEIYQQSKDSITLLFGKKMLVKFVPIDFSIASDISLKYLTNNEWVIIQNGEIERIHFLEKEWYAGTDPIRQCIIRNKSEMYSLKSFNGTQFLAITYAHTNQNIYQINSYENGIIYAKSYNTEEYGDLKLVRRPGLTSTEILRIKADLKGRWKTKKLMGYGSGMDDLSGNSQVEGSTFFEKIWLRKESLLANELSSNLPNRHTECMKRIAWPLKENIQSPAMVNL